MPWPPRVTPLRPRIALATLFTASRAIERAVAKAVTAHRERARATDVQGRIKTLTTREVQVFALVVTGMLNKQIAADLGIVEKTVKVQRARVMKKMGAGSLAELVRLADRAGIVPTR